MKTFERFIFIHVPKTAGSNMVNILKRNFKDKFFYDRSLYANQSYESWMVEHAFEIRPIIAAGSHMLRAYSVPIGSKFKFHTWTFVRNPTEIILSSYFHLRSEVGKDNYTPAKLDLEKCLSEWINSGFNISKEISFSQKKWIFNDQSPCCLEKRLKSADHTFHIFPTESFDDAMICLERMHPTWFRDCSYGKRVNITERDQNVSEKAISLIEKLPWIEKDRELHAYSYEYLENLLQQCFPNDGELEAARSDFRKRCEVRKKKLEQAAKTMILPRRIRTAGRVLLKGK